MNLNQFINLLKSNNEKYKRKWTFGAYHLGHIRCSGAGFAYCPISSLKFQNVNHYLDAAHSLGLPFWLAILIGAAADCPNLAIYNMARELEIKNGFAETMPIIETDPENFIALRKLLVDACTSPEQSEEE